MSYPPPIRALCLASLLVCPLLLSGCAESNEAPRTTQQKPRTLALVSIDSSGVSVKNLGEWTLPDVVLLLNVNRPGEKPVQAVVGDIPRGKTVTVPEADFTDIDGKRFDYTRTRIYTVAIKTPLETNADGYKLFVCSSNVCQPVGD